MCNEVARRISLDIMRNDFSQLKIPLVFPEGLPNLEAKESIRITDRTAIVKMAAEPEVVVRRWSWPGPTGKPVFNYRSEGRAFEKGRCLIPVDAFFEFTDHADASSKKKAKWRFESMDEDWFAIAGLWRDAGEVGEAFTMLTCPPGEDVARYHSRQIVVMPRERWAAWLDPAASDATGLIAPSAAGTFRVMPA